MGEIELKTCPFCGKSPMLHHDIRYPRPECERTNAFEIVCENYDCIIGFVDEHYYLTPEEAIQAWNRRFNEQP